MRAETCRFCNGLARCKGCGQFIGRDWTRRLSIHSRSGACRAYHAPECVPPGLRNYWEQRRPEIADDECGDPDATPNSN
jgi:hypothetical protein